MKNVFTVIITTHNRLEELKISLKALENIISRKDVECILCDDGSNDGTFNYINNTYPEIQIIANRRSQGLIYSRNKLMNLAKGKYVISLDDDFNFLTSNVLENIESHFLLNDKCTVLGFRIFWGKEAPLSIKSEEESIRMKSFVGCGHAWRLEQWRKLPNYPSWFIFYGEEDYMSFHIFKNGLEVHYLPSVLGHHRVDIRSRKQNNDYLLRTRRSLRSGWYLYAMFYPKRLVFKKITYSIYAQFKNKIIKGDYRVAFALCQALLDLILNTPKLIRNREGLSIKEFEEFCNLSDTKIYWKP
ncbi:glycosyltransferase family A protein [Croceibacter atlanticus]|uniref:glycosyltransferase family 2 protein n=1 Tax=Croceibacter atlanticus TaxID=313588 RepID=UPI0030D9E234|tara:strand:- start:303469 stop:304368 length:900 start_codon:yes stop_codon:yes gene_type:complete